MNGEITWYGYAANHQRVEWQKVDFSGASPEFRTRACEDCTSEMCFHDYPMSVYQIGPRGGLRKVYV